MKVKLGPDMEVEKVREENQDIIVLRLWEGPGEPREFGMLEFEARRLLEFLKVVFEDH